MRESNISIYDQYKQIMIEYESLVHTQCVSEIGTCDKGLITGKGIAFIYRIRLY